MRQSLNGVELIRRSYSPLRQQIVRGAAFLVGRSVLVVAISFVNVVLITREIGPTDYGIYVTVYGIIHYLAAISNLGIGVYLIRSEEEPSADTYNLAFTVLLVASVLIMALGYGMLPLLEGWLAAGRFAGPYLALLLALPAITLSLPAVAALERRLDYRSIAAIEVFGQIVFGVVAVTLAFRGAGVWAPVVGYMAWQALRVLIAWTVAGLRPRPHWSSDLLGDMVRYGLAFSSANWIWQLRQLVNPLVVGGILGPEAVALVGLAAKITNALSFVPRATWRLTLVAMAKVQRDPVRSNRLVDEAMLVQTMALGPFLSGFALFGPWLLPLLYDPEWHGLFIVYPFVALGALVNTVFNMHASKLYVRRRNLDMAIFHVVHIALFAGAALVFVRWFGLIGYGYAEVVALCSYWVIHLHVLKFLRPSYGGVVLWLVAYVPPLFAPLVDLALRLLLWLPLVAVVLLPRSRRQIQNYAAQVFSRRSIA